VEYAGFEGGGLETQEVETRDTRKEGGDFQRLSTRYIAALFFTHVCSYAFSSRLGLGLHELGLSRTDFWQTIYFRASNYSDHTSDLLPEGDRHNLISFFGEDAEGEFYLTDLSGVVYRTMGK
jgi:hypothetical protein